MTPEAERRIAVRPLLAAPTLPPILIVARTNVPCLILTSLPWRPRCQLVRLASCPVRPCWVIALLTSTSGSCEQSRALVISRSAVSSQETRVTSNPLCGSNENSEARPHVRHLHRPTQDRDRRGASPRPRWPTTGQFPLRTLQRRSTNGISRAVRTASRAVSETMPLYSIDHFASSMPTRTSICPRSKS